MTHNVLKNQAGFSLVELLVAVTIFAVGLLATASMQITALQSNAGAHKMTTINAAAAGIMEEILTWAPDDPRLVDDAGNPHLWDFDPATAGINPLTVQGGGNFNAQYTVSIDDPIENVSTITLEISSSGGLTSWGGNNRTLTCLRKTQ